MAQVTLTICPNCGLPLTAEHRKGNLMRCPACKTIFEIKLKSSQNLGKCPHGCGETIRIDDYIDDERLQCVHCHGYIIARSATSKDPWDPKNEEPPLLNKYLGQCPKCNKHLGDSDFDESGNLICPDCNTQLIARSEFSVTEKIGDCPICGSPLGKGDISVEDQCYCEKCNQIIVLDQGTEKIPEGDLFALPTMTSEEFKSKCFEQLFDNSPSDIASNLEIKDIRLSFIPADEAIVRTKENPETFKFCRSDKDSLSKKFSGKVNLPSSTSNSTQRGTRCHLPDYELVYNYKGEERKFRMKQGDKEAKAINLPKSDRLTGEKWLTSKESSLIILGFLIVGIIWWWNSSDGFFSGVWHLILLAIFAFIMFVIVVGPVNDAITHFMRSRSKKRKVKEFQSYHGLDFSGRN